MKIMTNTLKGASFAAIAKLASFVKVSFLLGSQMIWFSGINSVLPLAGAFGGVFGAALVFLMRQLLHLLFFKTVSLSFLALCIPGFCASLYWAQHLSPASLLYAGVPAWNERIFGIAVRLLLPLACMGLFVVHPVGSQAFFYSFYWLIPVGLYFVPSFAEASAGGPHRSLFLTALGSTFVAHAVGSVIWCYTVPMTAPMWMALMPIVLLERVLFALGMVVAHHALTFVFGKINNTQFHCLLLGSPYATTCPPKL